MAFLRLMPAWLGAALFCLFAFGCSTTGDKSGMPVYLIKIERGDTLASIAAKYDTTWQNIAKMNKIDKTSRLEGGMILRVRPGPGGIVAGAEGNSPRPKLARRLPSRLKNSGKASNAAPTDLPNRPAAAARQYEEDELDEAPSDKGPRKPQRGLLFNNDHAAASGQMLWPVRGDVSSGFGRRGVRPHQGIDIRATYGTPIYPTAAGRVTFEGTKSGYGHCVIIQHRGKQSLYAHLSSIMVDEGDIVDRETLIGKVGTSGNAHGAHLHFEIRNFAGEPVDPLPLLSRERYISRVETGAEHLN